MRDIHCKLLYLILGIGITLCANAHTIEDILVLGVSLVVILDILLIKHINNYIRQLPAHFVNPTRVVVVNVVTLFVLAVVAIVGLTAVQMIMSTVWFISINIFLRVIVVLIPMLLGVLIISYLYKKVITYLESQ